ncbi:ABC transporter permease [Aestuariimicrobium sp. p3-SID1156]|uniref:ABC transporter permease n=1 Tax=Aestuariimicrobium sp. p3-SID1156 TaxID=2916038 RepID=UPI00223B221A|nr:ABC transporter permease [Aestuariimicrobium sp. p3-SID1156]MCT1459320.1 ABC transporter permease [Aestuariimicrobium sp. p3-SID1156]
MSSHTHNAASSLQPVPTPRQAGRQALRKPESSLHAYARSFLHNRNAMLGLTVIVLMVLAAVFAEQITGYSPTQMNPAQSRQPPSADHWLGTDQLGRDVFARVLHGARTSIYVGVAASLLETLLGTVLGAIAGYMRGPIDGILMRISEVVMTFPNLILVMIFVSLLGQGVNNVVLVFALSGWMTTFRLVRSEFMSLREETFVEATRSFGYSRPRIVFKHMLPNALSPIVVAFTINIAHYIIAEAGLSFLGLGVPVTTPTWGNLLSAAESSEVMKSYWWLWVAPALAIIIFVTGINFVGDGLRDVLDPKTRRTPVRKILRDNLLGKRVES